VSDAVPRIKMSKITPSRS